MKKQQGQQNQKDDPRESTPNWPLLQQQSTYENPNRHESKCAEERIPRGCLNESDKFSHLCWSWHCHIVERRTREFYASNIFRRRQGPRATHSSPPPERLGAFLLKSEGAGR